MRPAGTAPEAFEPLSRLPSLLSTALLWAGLAALPMDARGLEGGLSAEGWMHFGHIINSSDTVGGQDFDGRSLQSFGVRLGLQKHVSDRLHIVAGAGVITGHMLPKQLSSKGGYAPFVASPFLGETRFTATLLEGESSRLEWTAGYFPLRYNPDSRNLGHYLLRGPVYPGIVLSGPAPNLLGFRLHHAYGGLRQDLILKSETELGPYFDLSPAYLAAYQGTAFRVGVGVNFHRRFPIHRRVTNGYYAPRSGSLYPIPSGRNLAFHGTKLTSQASFDLKALLGRDWGLGAEDMKIYGEAALFGLDNDSLHRAVYGGFRQRMPLMAGINLPAFRWLDFLSLEVEWYGARFLDDLSGYNAGYGSKQSPLPVIVPVLDSTGQPLVGPDGRPVHQNIARDNWKWSLQGAKTLMGRFQIGMRIANDHLRPGVYQGDDDARPPGVESVMTSPEDWYGSLRLSFQL